jgi:uroporphyrinogen-III decarboxylase
MWGKILGFNIEQFYTDPLTYLRFQLEMMIYRFEHWEDETCIEKVIPIWLGSTLESSLFGARTIYSADESPWLDREPVIKSQANLESIQQPNFMESGLMPLAHRFYDVLSSTVDDDFTVMFPEWGRSPFGTAFHIRGYENLAIDMSTNPVFTHRLMRTVTDARIRWVCDRAKFLGRPVGKGNIYNDEVNTPSLSPSMYEEFAFPYEEELSEFHGGILYWHSCGNTTALVPMISKIRGLEMFHVGPWTEPRAAVESFDAAMPLEFCLHPVRDVLGASPAQMENKLVEIALARGKGPYTVRADGLQILNGLDNDLQKINQWRATADRVLSRN